MIMIRPKPLGLALFCLAASSFAAAASEHPSFDCATIPADGDHEIEQLICGDATLAKADREMAAAYKAAFARLHEPARATLRDIQRDYLDNRNRDFFLTFEGRKIGVESPPAWSITKILQTGRRRNPKVFDWVEADMADRTAILNALSPAMTSPAGLWIGAAIQLELVPADQGRFRGTLSYLERLSRDYPCSWTGTVKLQADHMILEPTNQSDATTDTGATIDWHLTGIVLSGISAKPPEDSGDQICLPISMRPLLHLSKPVKLRHSIAAN